MKKELSWKELCQWAKKMGGLIVKKPFFRKQRIEFDNGVHRYVVYQNGCAGYWEEYIDFFGFERRIFIQTEKNKTPNELKKIIKRLKGWTFDD